MRITPKRSTSPERAALHSIEQSNQGAEWDAFRLQLRDLMEGSSSLLSWKEEHYTKPTRPSGPCTARRWRCLSAIACPTQSTSHWCDARGGAALAVARGAAHPASWLKEWRLRVWPEVERQSIEVR